MSLDSSKTTNQCSLIVSTCDKYSDLWVPFFNLIDANWPDCPYKIFLITEDKVFDKTNVISTKIGSDLDWSSLLKSSLSFIDTPYVLLMLEDFFLRELVVTRKIDDALEYMIENSVDMLRLIPHQKPPGRRQSMALSFNVIPYDERYRVSTQAALWRLDTLQNLLKVGESAWEFELNGSKRSSLDKSKVFESVSYPILPYGHHVVERGRWFPWEKNRYKKMNIGCDFSKRNTMSWWNALLWFARKKASEIKYLILDSWF